MFCTRCGAPVGDTWNACRQCGNMLREPVPQYYAHPTPCQPQSADPLAWLLSFLKNQTPARDAVMVAVAVVLVGSLVLGVYSGRRGTLRTASPVIESSASTVASPAGSITSETSAPSSPNASKYVLEVTSAVAVGNEVMVCGKTTLPRGTLLKISLRPSGAGSRGSTIGGEAASTGTGFSVAIRLDSPIAGSGLYEVTAAISQGEQPYDVSPSVRESGAHTVSWYNIKKSPAGSTSARAMPVPARSQDNRATGRPAYEVVKRSESELQGIPLLIVTIALEKDADPVQLVTKALWEQHANHAGSGVHIVSVDAMRRGDPKRKRIAFGVLGPVSDNPPHDRNVSSCWKTQVGEDKTGRVTL